MKLSCCLCAVLFINLEQILFCSSDQISIVRAKIKKIDHIIHKILGLVSRHYNNEVTNNLKLYEKPKDCNEIKENGNNKSGIYEVWPWNKRTKPFSFEVYCDMETDGGGWTVFQRRGDFGNPKDYFLKNWKNYSEGFGKLDEDFWLGNEKLYDLTNQGNYSMRVDMKDKEGNHRYAKFQEFKISSEEDLYELHVAGYSGNAGDSLTVHHNKQKFSTTDKDNDKVSSFDCANYYKGAWWYKSCYDSNLNGLYLNGPHTSYGDGIEWSAWKGLKYSLPDVEMKIRRE